MLRVWGLDFAAREPPDFACLGRELRPVVLLSGRGTTRAEDAQGTPTQSHISPSILVYEE